VGPSLIERVKTSVALKVQNTKIAIYEKMPNRPTMPTVAGIKETIK
jgi:hypothetical protein